MTTNQWNYFRLLMGFLDFHPIDNIVGGVNRCWIDTDDKLNALPATKLSVLIDFMSQAHEARTDEAMKLATDELKKLKIIL